MFRVITGALAIVALSTFSFVANAEEVSTNAASTFEVATNEGDTETEAAVDEDRTVCRRIRITGSHRVQRVCMTQSQWTAESERGRENIQHQETLGRNNTDAASQQ